MTSQADRVRDWYAQKGHPVEPEPRSQHPIESVDPVEPVKPVNGVPKLPDNLYTFSWGGSLPAKVFKAYPKLVIGIYSVILIVAGMAALVTYAITLNTTHLFLAIPATTWLGSFGILVAYAVSTRDVRVIRPGPNGKYILDHQKWFKSQMPFKEVDAKYEGGRRVLWLIYSPDKGYVPFTPAQYQLRNPSKVTAAQVAGIEAYRDSVREYAFKKNMTMMEQLRLGLVVIAIVALMFGIFVMTGRLRDDNRVAPQTASNDEVIRRASPAIDDGGGHLWW